MLSSPALEEGLLPVVWFGWDKFLLCCADDSDDFELGERAGGNPEALSVGADVRRGEEKPFARDEAKVIGCYAFDQVAVGQHGPQEKAFSARASGEGFTEQAFGIGSLSGVEIADEADPLDGLEA